jgi:hypothetical protein
VPVAGSRTLFASQCVVCSIMNMMCVCWPIYLWWPACPGACQHEKRPKSCPQQIHHHVPREPMLRSLALSREAFVACVAHALITEHEEVMGLLAGHWVTSEVCGGVVHMGRPLTRLTCCRGRRAPRTTVASWRTSPMSSCCPAQTGVKIVWKCRQCSCRRRRRRQR